MTRSPIRKILVPLDFSAASLRALEYAARVALREGASLGLVHVPEIGTVRRGGQVAAPRNAVTRRLKALVGSLAKRGIRRAGDRLLAGDPGQAIVSYARSAAFDLIVMGSSGRTGLERVLLGSVAEKVVKRAHCPVLVVRRGR